MTALFASIWKEILILIRDKAGLAILFLMPVVLVTVMALIQDAPFRDFQESQIDLLIVDEDRDSLSARIISGLSASNTFNLIKELDNESLTKEQLSSLIQSGSYKMGIFIPANTTKRLNEKSMRLVQTVLVSYGLELPEQQGDIERVEIELYVDPASKKSFKNSILSALKEFTSQEEMKMLVQNFSDQMAEMNGMEAADVGFGEEKLISFKEFDFNKERLEGLASNSVQHNVPAWAVFAMFFIVIPLAGNMIKERDDGSAMRLLVMPAPYINVFLGKIITYLFVCVIQFALMIAIGLLVLPLMGLPQFVLAGGILQILFIVICIGLAGSSMGILYGTVFKTHQQAATFGAVSVVILAAIGGIWIPQIVMPDFLRSLGSLSPLAWSLEALNDLFLREVGMSHALSKILKLIAFSLACLTITFIVHKREHA